MKKKCPACSQMRELFIGKICILCKKANERAMKEEGNWKSSVRFKTPRGIEIKNV